MNEMKKAQITALWLCLGLLFVLGAAFFVAHYTETDFLAHSIFDSYTLQALAWRDGRIALDQNYPWLELAIYQGDYYVSFPPVPTLPMLFLSFFFGANTPSALACLLYFLGIYAAAFFLLRRTLSPEHAAVFAAFAVLGGSMADIAISGMGAAGSVWYQAQLLAALCTVLAFLLLSGNSKRGWAAGLILIALAVGARPFNAIYVPVLLLILYQHIRRESIARTLAAFLPYLAVPALIAAAYGIYNAARFGNPLEFGHRYLPEFTESGEPMFSAGNILLNLRFSLRPFQIDGTLLIFPLASGFAAYFTNPMLLFSGKSLIERGLRRQVDAVDALLFITIVVHAATLLMHRTNGGWQYGTRYWVDTVPAALFLFARRKERVTLIEGVAIGGLIALNLYGTILFHSV